MPSTVEDYVDGTIQKVLKHESIALGGFKQLRQTNPDRITDFCSCLLVLVGIITFSTGRYSVPVDALTAATFIADETISSSDALDAMRFGPLGPTPPSG